MTTPEDRLAKLLRDQADTIQPAGDGLSKIQSRLASRRKARWFVVPSAALATTAAVAAFFVFGGSGQQTTLVGPVGGSPSATTSSSPLTSPHTCPSGMEPCPLSTPEATSPPYSHPPFAKAIWPFASQAQLDAWSADPSSKSWATSPLEVAQHFIDDYLKLNDVHLLQTCVSCDVVEIRSTEDKAIGLLTLQRQDTPTRRAYSVFGVAGVSPGFGDPQPEEGASISLPTTVSGTITGVDENVSIDLLSQTGKLLAHTSAPAGTGHPWSAELTWTDGDWYTGAIVLKTYSPKDGSLNRLFVRRVVRG